MVFRHVENNVYDIIGINDIPAGNIEQAVTYKVPDNERINVLAGDVLGYAWNSPGPKHIVLGHADDGDVVPHKLYTGSSPDTLNVNDRIDASDTWSNPTRAYSVKATMSGIVTIVILFILI